MGHAKLSPSSSHQWIHCAGSPALSATVEDTQDPEPAILGTAVHHMGETALSGWYGGETGPTDPAEIFPPGSVVIFEYNQQTFSRPVTFEMIANAKLYVDRVWEHLKDFAGISLELEKKIDLTHIRPKMFGHADAVITADDRLIVVDYKNGFVAVHLVGNPDALLFSSPEEADINPQLLIYACGAAEEALWIPREITLEIIQPRSMDVPPVQSVTVDSDFLFNWQETVLKPAAAAADQPNAPLKAGEWCRWCKARGICPALRDETARVAKIEFAAFADPAAMRQPYRMTDKELADVLEWSPIIADFLRQAWAAALARAQRGQKITGYKVVRGNGSRAWNRPDPMELLPALIGEYMKAKGVSPESPGFDEMGRDLTEALLNPVTMKSPAQVEELGAEWKKIIVPFVNKKPGGYNLALESNRRAEVVMAHDEFAEFATDVVIEADPFADLGI